MQAVRVDARGLYLQIDGLWCRAEFKAFLLDRGLCILLEQAGTHQHFIETYEVFWPGNPAHCSSPMMIAGGTDSPVVAVLVEQWLALPSYRAGSKLKVPSVTAAQVALPGLLAARHAKNFEEKNSARS